MTKSRVPLVWAGMYVAGGLIAGGLIIYVLLNPTAFDGIHPVLLVIMLLIAFIVAFYQAADRLR